MILTTDRLLLREFQDDDWPAVHAYAADPDVTRYTTFGPNTEEETRAHIARVQAWEKEQPRRNFTLAVTLKGENRVIGGCGFHLGDERQAELGYVLHKFYWGRGLMTEAVGVVLSFSFNELGLHRIISSCHPDNTGSARVMEKMGMRREGHCKESRWIKESWWDLLHYAILDREWQAQSQAGIPAATME